MALSDDERVAAFEHRFAQAQATEVVHLPWGYALLQADFPGSYNHNRVVVTSAASAAEILAATGEVLGKAGLSHRFVSVVDDLLGQALSADFVAAGFEHDTIAAMIHSGPALDPPVHEVHAVSIEELRPALIRDWRLELPNDSDDEIDQLADRTVLYAQGADVTFLAVLDGAEIAARANLYVDPVDHIAQFENLVTHPNFRGRGYANSLVSEAMRRGLEAGCQLSFLTADMGDWPREWYRRLGYVETVSRREFTRAGSTEGLL